MPSCRACVHAQRDRIDFEILNGTPLRPISAWSGCSIGGLCRHKEHIKGMIRERTDDERQEHGSALLNRVLRLCGEAEKILASASAKNDFRGANGALGASAKLLDLLARLSGELQSANTPGLHLSLHRTTNINVHCDDDSEIAALIAEATGDFNPAIIERFKQLAQGQKALPVCTNPATPSKQPMY